jgi:hypothetical protein
MNSQAFRAPYGDGQPLDKSLGTNPASVGWDLLQENQSRKRPHLRGPRVPINGFDVRRVSSSRKNLKTSLASELIFPQQRFVADMVVTMALLQAKKNSQHGRYFGGTAKKSGTSLRQ